MLELLFDNLIICKGYFLIQHLVTLVTKQKHRKETGMKRKKIYLTQREKTVEAKSKKF